MEMETGTLLGQRILFILIIFFKIKICFMDNSNFHRNNAATHGQASNNLKNLIIGLLAFGLVGSILYAISSGNKSDRMVTQQQIQVDKMTEEKNAALKSFDASLARLDSISGMNSNLGTRLSGRNREIARMKSAIRSILDKKNLSEAELSKARVLIGDLNDNITGLTQRVASLTRDNQSLTTDNMNLTQDKEKLTTDLSVTTTAKEDLAKKVDIGSTLYATNIVITPLDIKKNGKEKKTNTAKSVNKLLLSFEVNNRIEQPGSTDLYIVVTGPDGKPISSAKQDSMGAVFTTREEGNKSYTSKLAVDMETNKSKNVQCSFSPGENFQQGSYLIEIYQNGFKIGEGKCELRKGGLFS